MKRALIRWVAPCAVILCLVFSLLLASCGGGGGKKLVFMMWGDAEERAAVQSFLEKFAKKNPKIGMPKIIHLDSLSYWDKFQVMVAAGETPDVFYMGNEEIRSYLKQNILMDLTDMIEKDKAEIELDDFFKKPMEAFNVNGRQYGIAKDFATLVLYYNMDMFKERGVAFPNSDWTWNDLLIAAKKLTVREGNSIKVYGFIVENWASWQPAWVRSNGGRYMKDGKWVLGKEPWLSKNAQAYQFLADMMTKHKVAPDYGTKKQLGDTGTFSSQKVAMCAYGRWAVLKFKDIKDFRWNIAEIPKSPNTGERKTTLFTAAYCISKTSRYKEEAWKLIKFLTSKEGQAEVARSGQAIPIRKSVAYSDAFLNAKEINKYQEKLGNKVDHAVNLKALEYADIPPSHVNWLAIRQKLDQWFQPLFIGTATAESIIRDKQKAFEKILKE